jgi:diguanylate cyclase (GGDEF)-like protein/PAS domain S-box-containing protein
VSVRLTPTAHQTSAGADDAAAAALRELPEALILVFDQELRFVLTAGHALERLGGSGRLGDTGLYKEGEFVGGAFSGELWTQIEPLCRSALAGETRSREIWSAEGRCLALDVGPLRVHDAPPGSDERSVVAGGVAVILDITARRRSHEITPGERELAPRPLNHFEQVFERAPTGMGLLDQNGRWLLVNRALCEITGFTVEELIGSRFGEMVHPEDRDNDLIQQAQLLAGEIPAYQIEKRYHDASRELMSAVFSISLVRDQSGAPLHYIVQLQDISERKRLEEHLRHLADHDPLTGLRNRRLFEHDLKLQVARSQRYSELAALMVIDLDEFKQVNDRHGHKIGDDTLRIVARALTRRLRETDLVARLGGDEFAVLLSHTDEEGVGVVVDGLARVIRGCTIDVGDAVLHPSASIGFTLIDQNTKSAEQALVDADHAMYATKRSSTEHSGANQD